VVSFLAGSFDSLFLMDNRTRTSSVDPEETRRDAASETMQEIWLFSGRQTVALESIAVSMRSICYTVETIALIYMLCWIASAVARKLVEGVDA
jgi:hypothetical protein